MKINLFFTPISDKLLQQQENKLGFHIDAFTEKPPKWNEADIVLLGIPEYRGIGQENDERSDLDMIRSSFYQLKSNISGLKIADIGNLKPGPTLEDTYLRIEEVLSFLIKENCLPIIIGGSHDLTYGQYLSYVNLEQYVHLINIDSQINLGISADSHQNDSFLESIFTHKPNHLFGYSHLGFHGFSVDTDEVKILSQMGFECTRIGELKGKVQDSEPLIRTGNLFSFDIEAIRASDSPVSSSPFGLTAEEACQMSWYAGQHQQMSSFGLYGYQADQDSNSRSAAVYATMIWYFIEGFYCRKGGVDLFDSNYTKYIVPFEPEGICFYKDHISEKWWLEISSDNDSGKFARHSLIPCSQADYEEAMKGKIPDRWLQAQTKN